MRVVFLPEAYRKFRAYVHMIDYEISGFGKVTRNGDDLVVEDIKIFEQTVTGGHTEIHASGEAGVGYRKFWDDLELAGEDPSLWKLWWHSHVNMPAYFSGTDTDTIAGFDFEQPAENWLLSIVTNKKGETYVQADIFAPLRCSIRNLVWDVAYGELANQGLENIREEIDTKVTIKTWRSKQKPKTEIVYQGQGLCSVPRVPLSPERRAELEKQFPTLFPANTVVKYEGEAPNSPFWDTASEEEWDEYWERYYAGQMGMPDNYDDDGVEEGEIITD